MYLRMFVMSIHTTIAKSSDSENSAVKQGFE